jgi:DNA-binding winged helix-turn-helix (wHTH) protein
VRVCFGDCVFDSLTREVIRGGEGVRLSPKAFQFLEVLVERRPAAVSKSDLQAILWPDTFVSESSLAKLAAEVRDGLGDDARAPRFIRTVYGFGFAFLGDATPDGVSRSEPVTCRLLWDAREFVLDEGEHVIGRTVDAQVWINHGQVSRRHARIHISSGRATLEDLGSRNGTFLRGERLQGSTDLADGDEIRIGPALLRFRARWGSGSTATEPSLD